MNLINRTLALNRIVFLNIFLKPHFQFCSQQPFINFQTLKQIFTQHRDMVVFNDMIIHSNRPIDNINYFKIYKMLEETNADIRHYQDFFQQLNITVTKKSDNIRMLLAKIRTKIAYKHEQNQNYYDTLNQLEDALGVLQESLVPPLLLYYQIYRYYGQVQYKLGNKKQALQALSESVDMIQRYLQHSDDKVASNQNSKSQAKAYNTLIKINPQKADEWLSKALEEWKDYEGNKFELQEYAQTVAENARKQYKNSKQKGEGYLQFNLYQFNKPELKAILLQVKKQCN